MNGRERVALRAPSAHDGPGTGRGRASPAKRDDILRRHGRRFASFSVIGGGVFIAGLLLQAALTTGLHVNSLVSYLVQAVVSVESSYFLNRWLTWKEAKASFLGSFLRFNLQKAVTVTTNLILYGILLKLGVEYLLDNVLLTVVFTFVNYIGADRLVFLRGGRHMVAAVTGPLPLLRTGPQPALRTTGPLPAPHPDQRPRPRAGVSGRELPSVSVVIPVRSNERTILAAVESVLGQDYPELRELVLVGSRNDSTWSALRGVRDPRLHITEADAPPGIRDANFKRDLGIRQTTGDLVSLIDSDMVIPPDWLSNAVQLLAETQVDCVAGVMRSIRDDFWGRFVDRNRLGAKTPRATSAYLVTAEGFGAAGFKPPITADTLFTRKMYEDCPIDPTWSHGSLEDYEWFWRVVERGHQVIVSDKLFGWHHHRVGFRNLSREYRRSARGCAYFIRAHRESPFAQKRLTQAAVLPLAAFGALLSLAAVFIENAALAVVLALAAGAAAMTLFSAREFARSRTLESLVYPVPALILGLNYTASLATHLIRNAPMSVATPTTHDLPVDSGNGRRGRRGRRGLGRLLHPLAFILAVQAAISLSLVWSNTGFGDEEDYLWVGGTLLGHLLHGTAWPSEYAHSTLSGLPFLYPPLGALANSVGGLAAARGLALLFLMCTTGFIYAMGAKLYGRTAAICAAALWAVFSPAIDLGAFATFDAPSVTLTACAAWVVLKVNDVSKRGEMIALAAVILAVAEATAYSGLVMAPIVVVFAALTWSSTMGAKRAISCAAWLAFGFVVVFGMIMTVCKTWGGLLTTVIARQTSAADYASVGHVFDDSWTYSGFIALLGVLGAIFVFTSSSRTGNEALTAAYLALVALVVPVSQAHDTTATSLRKHLAYGAIFACLVAGYGVARLAESLPANKWVALACALTAFTFPLVNGVQQSGSWFQSWPNQSSLLSALTPVLGPTPDVAFDVVDSTFLCDYLYADSGNAWEGCSTNVTIGSVQAAAAQYIVVSYPGTLPAPYSDPASLLQASPATQEQLLSVLAGNASATNSIQSSPEIGQVTTNLVDDQLYHLIAAGPYSSNQAAGLFTIWERY